MSSATQQFELPEAVRHVLRQVRRGVRMYVWLEGVAALVILLGVAFWVGMLLDWLFEPSPEVRRIVNVIVAFAALGVVYRFLVRRVFVPLSDASLAVLLERRFHQLNDHVLTAVHLASPRARTDDYHPELISRTQEAAAESVLGIRTSGLFNRRPLRRKVTLAVGLCVSVAAFWVLAGDLFGFWIERIRLSPEPWPRRVHLAVVGFPADSQGRRTQKIAQDDDFGLVVHAAARDFVVPDEVEIRFRLADGRRGRDTMIRVGEAMPGRDEFQSFRYEFKNVSGSMTFDVVGGDDRVNDLHLQVVDRPELFSMEIACQYPDYLRRPESRLPVTGGMRIPEGSHLTLHASATKPLTSARIHTTRDEPEAELAFTGEPSNAIHWDYGTLSADEVLLVNVTDVDGVACREPYRVSLSVVPDELPQVAVRLAGIGTAITPEATIPLAGKITDDYGLERIWFESQVGDGPTHERQFTHQPDGLQTQSTLDSFDTRATDEQTRERVLRLRPGQKLHLAVKATDRYNLAVAPRAGSSQQFSLDVVTAAELLALLERRELSLRQRFEAIYEKVTDTRNLLGRVDFLEVPKETNVDNENVADDAGDGAASSPEEAARRSLARRGLRVAGSLQNVAQSASEVLGVAEAFDDIHDQLVNNRIDNADLKKRLRDDIAEPLHEIGRIRMPQLEAQLELVQEHVESPEAGPPALAASLVLADEILVEMRHVLDRMLELETYNEVLSILRDIISDQEEINRKTKDQQKERLEGLLDE